MACRVLLAAENHSAHRTICDFRGVYLDELSQLLVQVVTDEGQRAYGKLPRRRLAEFGAFCRPCG